MTRWEAIMGLPLFRSRATNMASVVHTSHLGSQKGQQVSHTGLEAKVHSGGCLCRSSASGEPCRCEKARPWGGCREGTQSPSPELFLH